MGRMSLFGIALLLGRAAPGVAFEMTEEDACRVVVAFFERHGYEDADEWHVNAVMREMLWYHRDLFRHVAGLATHPELLPFLERYDELKREALGEGVHPDVRVVFSRNALGNHLHDGENEMAWCEPLTRTVFMDRGFWESVAEHALFREAIVFHELGHCDLDRSHDSNFASMTADDARFSLMDAGVKGRLFWPGFDKRYALTTERLFNDVWEGRFGGDPASAYGAMVEELFSKRGTVAGSLTMYGGPAPETGLYMHFMEFIVPMLRRVEMRYAFEQR